jgi:uncharacterized OB-fold protein
VDLKVVKCTSCGKFFVSAFVCDRCSSENFEEAVINGKGKIFSFTTIRVAPEIYKDQAPYDLALIDLPENLRVTARIKKDPAQNIAIGKEVTLTGTDATGCWFAIRE